MAPGSEFRSVYQRHEAPAAPTVNPYMMPHPDIPPPPIPTDAPPAYAGPGGTVDSIPEATPEPEKGSSAAEAGTSTSAPPAAPNASAPSFEDLSARFAALRNNNS